MNAPSADRARSRRPPPRRRCACARRSLQIVRDPCSILIAVVLPLILLFLFGYGVSLDANDVRIGVVVESDSSPPRASLAATFRASRFFDVRVARDRRAFEAGSGRRTASAASS